MLLYFFHTEFNRVCGELNKRNISKYPKSYVTRAHFEHPVVLRALNNQSHTNHQVIKIGIVCDLPGTVYVSPGFDTVDYPSLCLATP